MRLQCSTRVLQIVDNLRMGEDLADGPHRHWHEEGEAYHSQVRLFGFASTVRRILHEGRYDAVHDHQDYAAGWHFAVGAAALPPMLLARRALQRSGIGVPLAPRQLARPACRTGMAVV